MNHIHDPVEDLSPAMETSEILSKCLGLVGHGCGISFQQHGHHFSFDVDFLSEPFPMPQVNVFMANLSSYFHGLLF